MTTDVSRARTTLEAVTIGGPHQTVSDAELIALVIRSGLRGVGATALGQRLIDRYGSLAAVLASSAESLAAAIDDRLRSSVSMKSVRASTTAWAWCARTAT